MGQTVTMTLTQSMTILTYLATKTGKFMPDHLATRCDFLAQHHVDRDKI